MSDTICKHCNGIHGSHRNGCPGRIVNTQIPIVNKVKRKHAHYFKDVAHLTELDVYRVLDLFGITDQRIGHSIKKLLVAGGRGAGKDIERDIDEVIDTLLRRKEMILEDQNAK